MLIRSGWFAVRVASQARSARQLLLDGDLLHPEFAEQWGKAVCSDAGFCAVASPTALAV
jgi:hypothetical protein